MEQKTKGVLFILAASLMWGIESILSRLSSQNSTSLKTAAFALLFGSITALCYAFFRREVKNHRIGKKELKVLVIMAFFGTAIAQPLYYLAISKTSLLNAVLIVHTQPIFIILISYFLMKEKLTKYDYIGGFFALIATLFVTSGSIDNLIGLKLGSYGDLLALAATIMWAAIIFPAKIHLSKVSPSLITALRFGIAASLLVSYLIITGNFMVDNIYQILIGITIGIGAIFYYEGLKRIKAAQVSFIELAAPFFTAIMGFYIFSENVTRLQIFSFPILGIGLWLIAKHGK